MKEYHKIQSIYLRDPANNNKTFLEGQFAKPEFEWLKNNEWVFTEKVDGTNIRVHWDSEKIIYGGRTKNAQIPATLIQALNNMFHVDGFKKVFDGPVTLYGEGYGPKIQKGGGNYRKDQSFVLFDVRIGDIWLEHHNVMDIGNNLKINWVPTSFTGSLLDGVILCKGGFKSKWGDFQAEGVVARPAVELLDRRGHRIITKIKCKDFVGGA